MMLIPTRAGAAFHTDEAGNVWRVYAWVDGTTIASPVPTPEQVERAARAVGRFQRDLIDLPGPPLHETLPGFHDTRRRLANLDRAIREDRARRATSVRGEIDFIRKRQPSIEDALRQIETSAVPPRIVHNDAKISNVVFDADTHEAVCLVDLDTVMPGRVAWDVGDMVRSMTSGAAEDEPDTARIGVRLDLFEALMRGYLTEATFLTEAERASLVTGAWLITLEQAIRFLTDHIDGDRYYRTRRSGHNLDRARTQLALARSLEDRQDALERIVRSIC